MGEFYDSIHVRTDDRGPVLAAVRELAASRPGGRYFIAPPIRGWTTVFASLEAQAPDAGGPGGSAGPDVPPVSRALAEKLGLEVLHVNVHDSDVLSYWVFRHGRLVDEYCSCPSYFGAVTPERIAATAGSADALATFLRGPAQVESLRKLLSRRATTREQQLEQGPRHGSAAFDRLEALLSLPNAANSYEYLEGGETEGVAQWRRFEHVPDEDSPQAAARREAAALKEAIQRAKAEGRLLCEVKGDPTAIGDTLVPDAAGGFLVHLPPKRGEAYRFTLRRLAPPWKARGAESLVIGEGGTVHAVTGGGSRCVTGEWLESRRETLVRCRDTRTGAVLWERSENADPPAAAGVGEVFLMRMRDRVDALEWDGGGRRWFYPLGEDWRGVEALHPDGRHLILAGGRALRVIRPGENQAERRLTALTRLEAKQAMFRAIGPGLLRLLADSPASGRKPTLSEAARLARTRILLSTPRTPNEQRLPDELLEVIADELAQAGVTAAELREAVDRPPPPLPEARVAAALEEFGVVACSADGRFVATVSGRGIKVYAWEGLVGAEECLPAPLHVITPVVVQESNGGQVMEVPDSAGGALFDPRRGLLLWWTHSGALRAMRLPDGDTATLLQLPPERMFTRVVLSSDGETCAGHTRASHGRGAWGGAPTTQVWAYRRLLESALWWHA